MLNVVCALCSLLICKLVLWPAIERRYGLPWMRAVPVYARGRRVIIVAWGWV